MPKVGMTLAQKELAEDLRSRYGGMMRVSDVTIELGYKDRRQAVIWLEDVPAYQINGKKRYRVSDIARKLDQCKID